MFCANCGVKNKNDAEFCAECGHKISSELVQEIEVDSEPTPTPNRTRPRILKSGFWFKLSLVLVIPVTAVVLVYGFVIYPESIRKEEREAAERQARSAAIEAETKEQERAENLKECLDESESQETYAHLAYCGSDGRSPSWCSDAYGGATNFIDTIRSLTKYVPDMTPLEAFEKCNCKLEGWIREGFEEDKVERDKLCYSLYSI